MSMQWTDPMRVVSRALAATGSQPGDVCAALCEAAQELVGHQLFTLTTCDPATGEACRIYSNMPNAYPVSGRKPMDRTDWSKQVIERHQTFVANSIEAIAEVFPDHELINSLGCQSVINVPIVVASRVIGTINCLHETGHYTTERVALSEGMKLAGAVCFLHHQLIQAGGAP